MGIHQKISFKNAETLGDAQWLLNNVCYDARKGKLWIKSTRKQLEISEKKSHYGAHLRLNGKSFIAMRVAWLLTYARWPDGHILPLNGWWHDIRSTNLFEVHLVDGEHEAISNLLPSTKRMMRVETNKRFLQDLVDAGHKIGTGERKWKEGIPVRIIPPSRSSMVGSSAGLCAESGD